MPVNRQVYTLAYAVRPRLVLKYLGQLGLAVAIATLVPLAVALVLGDYALMARLGLATLALGGSGILLARQPASDQLQTNEALITTALIFLLAPLAMSFPLMGPGVSFLDALFEAVSAITTTGLTTLGKVSDKSDAYLFTRAWMQWYGGLGIVVLSLSLLVEPGSVAHRLGQAAIDREDLVTGTWVHARRVLQVYLALTAAGFLLLWLSGVEGLPALLHTLSGISTGGFSSYDASLAGLGRWSAQAMLMLLTLAGAVSLGLYHPAYRSNWRARLGYVELKGLLAAALVSIVALTCSLWLLGGADATQTLLNAPLIALSAQTGAGFTSMPLDQVDPASKLVLILSMLIGGGMGSTSGGIKVLRLLILLRLLQTMLRRSALPQHAVLEPRLGRHRLAAPEIEHALLILLLFAGVILCSWLPFLAMGYAPLDSLFEVVSATATVGLSTGITAPVLPPLLKAVLCLDMWAGRLEVVALLLVLYPRSWVGQRRAFR